MTDREAQIFYRHIREVWGLTPRKKRKRANVVTGSTPFSPGRDPLSLDDTLALVTETLGWTEPLAQHELFARWPELVGEEIASRATPESLAEGELLVKCDSTAWATQLRMLRHELIDTLDTEFPHAGVKNIRFLGPDVPSWKKGPRAIPGRGPRDTYG